MASQPDLTNVAISSGYATLIHTQESGGVSGTATNLYDGDGTLIPMSFSTSVVSIIDGAYNFDIASHDGTNGLKLGGTLVTSSATELNYLDVSSIGTAQASKALILDSSSDISGIRNLTATGTIQASNFTGTGNTQIGDAVADTVAMNATITTNLVFEGSTANAYETTLSITDPTADRTWTIPDATDTSVGRATTDTLTNKTLTAPDINTPDIDGGTVDAITSLTVANNVDIGAYDLRAGTLTADGLTSGRVVFAGTNGVLSDDSDVSFSGATLSATNVTSSGTIQAEQLTTTDDLTVSGLATVGETLAVTGVATFTAQSLHNGGMSTGAMVINDGTISDSSGAISFSNENLTTSGTFASGTQTVTGNVTASGTVQAEQLTTTDDLTVSGLATIGETLAVTGTLSSGTQTVTGNITASGTIQAEQLTTTDDLSVSGLATVGETLGVTGVATFTAQSVHNGGLSTGALVMNDGSITDSSGSLSFGDEALSTSGTLGAGATTVTSLSLSEGNITNVGDINVDTVSSDDGSGFDLVLDDNKATALEIKESSNAYLTFVTTDSGEKITLGKKLEAGSVEIEGSAFDINGGTIDGVTMATSDITVGSGKTLNVSAGTLTLANNQISGDEVEGGTIAGVTITALTTAGITASANIDIGSYTLRASNILADARTAGRVAFYGTDGALADDADMTFDTATLTVTNLIVGGTLTTAGAVEISSTTLNVQDPLVLLNKFDSQPANNTFDAGVLIKRGSSDSAPANVAMIWDESADQFAFIDTTEAGDTAGNIAVTDYENLRVGALTADDNSTFTGTISTASGSTIGDLTLANGSITSSGSAISFGSENLSTSGTLASGTQTVTGNVTASGTIQAEQLTTTDDLSVAGLATVGETLAVTGVATFTAQSVHNGGMSTGALVLNDASITDTSGAISFSDDNLSTSGTLSAGVITATGLTIGSAVITEAELEILDGATVTTSELNIMDGSATDQATVTLVAGDGVVISDGDVMKQALVSDFEVYMEANLDTMGSQFTSASSLATVGTITTGVWNAGAVTSSGVGTFASLDISGAIDVVGTTNLDVVDIDGAVDMASTLTMGSNILMADDTSIGIADDAERIEFDGAGDISVLGAKFGVGVNPTQLFHVEGASSNDWVSRIKNTHGTAGQNYGLQVIAGANASDISFVVKNKDNDATYFEVQGDGKVGIGTATDLMSGAFTSSTKLSIYTASQNRTVLELGALATATGEPVGKIEFINNDNADATNFDADSKSIGAIQVETVTSDNNAGDDSGGKMYFYLKPEAGSITGVMALDSNSKISLSNNDSGTHNTTFGHLAGASLDAGSNYNVFIGAFVSDASMNDAVENVGIGYSALSSLEEGDSNIAIGYSAGYANANASGCILIGDRTGESLNSVDSTGTIAIGSSAGGAITTGIGNTAIGYQAFSTNDDADYNTAIGYQSMQDITTSMNSGEGFNTAVGAKSMHNSTTSMHTVAVGYNALGTSAHSGNGNTAVGYLAGTSMVGGHSNTGIGRSALGASTAGVGVVAVGYGACGDGAVTAVAVGTTAVGTSTLSALTSGVGNTAVGYQALIAVETGTYNTAVGHQAGDACTGDGNTLLGAIAGGAIIGGDGNTCIGQNAGDVITDGANNTIVGAGSDSSASGGTNQIVLGHSVTGSGDSTFTFGESTTDTACTNGGTSWSNPSDVRIKKEITTSTAGLSMINDLRPVNFKFKTKGEVDSGFYLHEEGSTTSAGFTDETVLGFIAQEVKSVIDNHPEYKGDELWSEGLETQDKRQRIAPSALIPMMVKAVQELSDKLDTANAKITALENA